MKEKEKGKRLNDWSVAQNICLLNKLISSTKREGQRRGLEGELRKRLEGSTRGSSKAQKETSRMQR